MGHQLKKTFGAFFVFMLIAMSDNSMAITEEERELARAAIPDTTPQEFYKTAISEAGGAFKEARKECAALPKADRQACLKEAKSAYDEEMAKARALMRKRDQ